MLGTYRAMPLPISARMTATMDNQIHRRPPCGTTRAGSRLLRSGMLRSSVPPAGPGRINLRRSDLEVLLERHIVRADHVQRNGILAAIHAVGARVGHVLRASLGEIKRLRRGRVGLVAGDLPLILDSGRAVRR